MRSWPRHLREKATSTTHRTPQHHYGFHYFPILPSSSVWLSLREKMLHQSHQSIGPQLFWAQKSVDPSAQRHYVRTQNVPVEQQRRQGIMVGQRRRLEIMVPMVGQRRRLAMACGQYHTARRARTAGRYGACQNIMEKLCSMEKQLVRIESKLNGVSSAPLEEEPPRHRPDSPRTPLLRQTRASRPAALVNRRCVFGTGWAMSQSRVFLSKQAAIA